MYNYLIVGSGLYGSICARELTNKGHKVLVLEKRDHIGGNIYTENIEGINVHKYGAHIFHTNNKQVWDYVNKYAVFNRYTNSPIANYKGELYSLPFNMYTFNKMWNVNTPQEAKVIIEKQKQEIDHEPQNLEEQAISLVGRDIFERLIKGYTEKQWGRDCKDLPSFIIKRLPVRFTYDNNYFNALYQGIPVGGYTKLIENLLDGIEVRLNTDYLSNKDYYGCIADKIIYTGPIDAYFDYKLGYLEYRSVRFETELLDVDNYQGNAVVNYTDSDTPYTRIIEHKWFEFGKDINGNEIPKTVISKEYSSEWKKGDEPYYPVNDERNSELYKQYKELADKQNKVIFGGRLGEYRYYDMNQVVEEALSKVEELVIKKDDSYLYALNSYFYILYKCNQQLVKLCGADAINNLGESEYLILEIVSNIPRVVPYHLDNKAQCLAISDKDGLMEFAANIPDLRSDYEHILDNNRTLLDSIRQIRNQYEHKMHNIHFISASSGNVVPFVVEFSITKDNKDIKIKISSKDLISLFKDLNLMFSKIVYEVSKEALYSSFANTLYHEKLSHFDFEDFNKLYNSDIGKVIGRLQYDY